MKQTLLALGVCITSAAVAQQTRLQPLQQLDSLHVVLHTDQNGTLRTLDTIVPVSQQQSLFQWMDANGWDTPPPPPLPAPGMEPVAFDFVIVHDDSIAAGVRGERHVRVMKGSCDPIPPVPPGAQVRMKHDDGEAVFMRAPAPPPGTKVDVSMQEKDTVIDGQQRKMIIRTERIILPEGMEPPPAPPLPPAPPTPPQGQKQAAAPDQKELSVYPNPTSSVVTVEFDVAAKEKTTLRVLDMNGKAVYTEEITDSQDKHIYREINLSDKGKGTYTVEVKSAKKAMAKKVIVQ